MEVGRVEKEELLFPMYIRRETLPHLSKLFGPSNRQTTLTMFYIEYTSANSLPLLSID